LLVAVIVLLDEKDNPSRTGIIAEAAMLRAPCKA
jgi:hypothetical protein